MKYVSLTLLCPGGEHSLTCIRDEQALDAARWSAGFSMERKTNLDTVALPTHQLWEAQCGQCVSVVFLQGAADISTTSQ